MSVVRHRSGVKEDRGAADSSYPSGNRFLELPNMPGIETHGTEFVDDGMGVWIHINMFRWGRRNINGADEYIRRSEIHLPPTARK